MIGKYEIKKVIMYFEQKGHESLFNKNAYLHL